MIVTPVDQICIFGNAYAAQRLLTEYIFLRNGDASAEEMPCLRFIGHPGSLQEIDGTPPKFVHREAVVRGEVLDVSGASRLLACRMVGFNCLANEAEKRVSLSGKHPSLIVRRPSFDRCKAMSVCL